MTLSIELPPDLENALRRRAEAAGEDLATFVRHVVTESLADEEEPISAISSQSEFASRLDSWIALHPVLAHAIDDSRDSIYAGRGE